MSVPFPDRNCPACTKGEQVIVPPKSSIVGSMGVHTPSGNVCAKYIDEKIWNLTKHMYEEQ